MLQKVGRPQEALPATGWMIARLGTMVLIVRWFFGVYRNCPDFPKHFILLGVYYINMYIYIYICMTILFVSWDDYYQYMESHKSHVPKHQPDICIHTVYTGPSPSSPSSSPRWFLGLPHIGRHCGEGIRCNLRTSAAHGAQQSGLASIGHAHLRNSRSGTIWIWDNLGSEEL